MIWVRNVSLLAAIALLATPPSLHRLLPMFRSHRRVTLNSLHALLRAPPSRAGATTKRAAAGALRAVLFVRWGSLFEHLIPYPCVSRRRGWPECAETSSERTRHVQITAVSCKSGRVWRVG